MKKIDINAAAAFVNLRTFKAGNTVVTPDGITLHGNLIAKRENGEVRVSLAGWNTPTTRARLNAVLQAVGISARFGQYKHGAVTVRDGIRHEISSTAWYKLGSF